MTPGDRLRAIAKDCDDEVARIGRGVGVRVVMPHGTSDEEMRAESKSRLERLRTHHEGRARLYRRCAEAADTVDAMDHDDLAGLA